MILVSMLIPQYWHHGGFTHISITAHGQQCLEQKRYVILLTLRDHNIADSFSICHLLSLLGMIYVYVCILHTSTFIYNYGMYRWHDYEYMSMCALTAVGTVC